MGQVEEAIARSNANVGGDILTLGTQSHNVRAVGLLGGGKDPLDPANVSQAAVIETEKLDDIRDVVIATAPDGTPIYVRQVAQVDRRAQAPPGHRRPRRRGRRRRRHRA